MKILNNSDLLYSEVPLKGKNKTLVKILGGRQHRTTPADQIFGGSRPLQPLRRWRLWLTFSTRPVYMCLCVFVSGSSVIHRVLRAMRVWLSSGELDDWSASLRTETTAAVLYKSSVSDRRTFPVLRSTCSWRTTTNVGKPSATGQPTRPTQPFILTGSQKIE